MQLKKQVAVRHVNLSLKTRGERSRIIRLLAKLIATEKHITITNAINSYKHEIQYVIDCMWNELIMKYSLLEHSTHYDDELNQQVKDKDEIINDIHHTLTV